MDYREIKFTKKIENFEPWTYYVSKDIKTVVYAVEAHGKLFSGKAKCGPHDEFDAETGKIIAHMRAVLKQRQFDLELTRRCIDSLKVTRKLEIEYVGTASPHFMRAIQAASEEEKAQLAHIADIKARLKQYEK